MLLTEYDEELHIRSEKQLSYKEGMERGMEQCIRLFIQNYLNEGNPCEALSDRLQKSFSLSAEQALSYVKKYAQGR